MLYPSVYHFHLNCDQCMMFRNPLQDRKTKEIILHPNPLLDNQVNTASGAQQAMAIAKVRKAYSGPNFAIMGSMTATPTAPRVHRTRLFIAVALAPLPGQRSETSVWLAANTALLVAAMMNCRARGTAMYPARSDTDCGTLREKPYPVMEMMKSATIHHRLRRRACSMGKPAGMALVGMVYSCERRLSALYASSQARKSRVMSLATTAEPAIVPMPLGRYARPIMVSLRWKRSLKRPVVLEVTMDQIA
ncbi:hypothetical protein FJTKL_05647 [Diaporthe vaccinii]|uniref:Uncharacterized protein n=1 Tax=Diaporthe vaccinii TaxID=105482 RepID=A0ABR4DSF8_9PEZI